MIDRSIFFQLLLFLISSLPGLCQEPLSRSFDTKFNGNSFKLQSILLDHQGNLICGTGRGLMKFNGIEFQEAFENDSGSNHEIQSLYKGHNSRIWVGYKNGRIGFIQDSKFSWLKQDIPFPTSPVTSFAEDSLTGRLFYSTLGEGIFYVYKGLVHKINDKNDLSDNYCYKILLLPDHRLCVATDQGINFIKFNGNTFSVTKLNSEHGLPDNIVRNMMLDKQNNLLISLQDKGFCVMNPLEEKSKIVFHSIHWKYGQVNTTIPVGEEIWVGTENSGVIRLEYNEKKNTYDELPSGIKNNAVKSMLSDPEGHVWIAGGNQLIRSSGNRWTKLQDASGNIFPYVHRILVDHAGNIWFSPDQQLYCARKRNNGTYEFKKYHVTKPEALTDIVTLVEDEQNNIWIGTLGEGIFVMDTKREKIYKPGKHPFIQSGNVMSIEELGDEILVGGFGGIHDFKKTYDEKSGNYILDEIENEILKPLKNIYVYSIHTNKKQETWIGTDESGLIRYSGNKLRYFTLADGLPSMTVQSITSDSNGNIWLATQGGGISFFDGNKFENISIAEGLSDLSPVSISIDRNNHVVIVNSNGIDLLDPVSKTFQYYSAESGLGEINPDLNSISKSPDGAIWFGTERGIFNFSPAATLSWHQPRAEITSVLLFLEPLGQSGKMKFSYDQNNITFNFNAPWYSDPNRLTYSYQLDGFSQKWQGTRDHSINYPKLPPGKYTFRVRASLNDNYSPSSESSFEFEIKAPFWQSIWFRLLLSLCILLIIGLIMRRREFRLRTAEKTEKEKIEFKFETLRNQVNPHFLFNSFNTLITVIENDPKLAIEYVENLSQFFRSIVSYKDVEVISLEEEIGLLENYIFIQSKRYGDSLSFLNKTKDRFDDKAFIPPLTLQLLAENALKHNAVSHESPLIIELFIKDDYLVMRNNINPKYHHEESTGIGLQNIKNRYKILSDKSVKIVEDREYFSVSVPILTND